MARQPCFELARQMIGRLFALVLVVISVQGAGAQSTGSSGKDMLPLLEGRWSNSNCAKEYVEFRFATPDRQKLTFNHGPKNASNRIAADVLYDSEGNVVVYFPGLSYRVTVRWINKDQHESIDIDKDGKTSRSIYNRCKS